MSAIFDHELKYMGREVWHISNKTKAFEVHHVHLRFTHVEFE